MSMADRRVALLLVACLTAALVTSMGAATPAQAHHQYCSPDAIGIHKGGFAPTPVRDLKADLLVLELADERIVRTASLWQSLPNNPLKVPKGYAVVISYGHRIISGIVLTSLRRTITQYEQRNAEMTACTAVLGGDMVDALFVGRIEAQLAAYDPDAANAARSGATLPNGVMLTPTVMSLLPDDAQPAAGWSVDAHGIEGLQYNHGFLTAPYIGVAVVVRNAIAHLEAHTPPTTVYEYDPSTGGFTQTTSTLPEITRAKELWRDAMAVLGGTDPDYRHAYALFAEAYQTLMTPPVE